MSVRRATQSDAGALGRIHIETWQIAYAGMFPSEFLAGLDLSARVKWFQRNIKQHRPVLVADEGEGAVGFCFAGDSSEPGWGEVYAIYVHPDHWGQGHGRDLLIAAEDLIRSAGLDRGLLWVLEPNRAAREFYESQGWVLGRPRRIEEIGGTQVNEVRYEKDPLTPS